MGIHGDDVARVIATALQETETCPIVPPFFYVGNGEGWTNRDGDIVIEAVGRDWFRAFRITVKVIDVKEVEADLQDDWKTA